jgi:2-phospho-L-lactate transferase/gluconeogenesis factor (CofD/UPF0052 family)
LGVPAAPSRRSRLRVVLFSGGRGSGALTTQLVSNPRVELTLAINGYDDGASTGAIRRFLGDALGPSDFRKNASRLARALGTAAEPLIDLLDLRLDGPPPDRSPAAAGTDIARAMDGASTTAPWLHPLAGLAATLTAASRQSIEARLARFARELETTNRPFDFADCSVGNIVFAGAFLLADRRFNAAVDDYSGLLGLRPGIIENVTDGADAFLVAIDADGRLLGSEEEIVDAKRRNRIQEIFLLASRPGPEDLDRPAAGDPAALARRLEARAASIRLNPRLAAAVRDADLIIYAPGTQHSSLFPSYLTRGLSEAIAANLTAIKLLVTNIQADAEITGSSAVDIIERAVYYLKEKGQRAIPTPCLITHYLLNDPQHTESEAPYVPLGRLESLEDPRLVRVSNYEEGVTGRHNAAKILGPFIDAFVARWETTERVAIVLYEAGSATKVVQSILEMIRGGIRDLPVDIAVFHDGPQALEPSFVASLGVPATRLEGTPEQRDRQLRAALELGRFDYAVLFESSGMYNGEDIANLASHLSLGRLDAVWGSRRLSVKDIHESYRLKYQHRNVLGAISYVGSHVLSLLYLTLYGRYVSDTLSAVRVVRASDVSRLPCLVTDKLANQHLLSLLLRRKAEMFEVPVQFFSISPAQVRRTTPFDGLQAVWAVLRGRVRTFAARRTSLPSDPALPAESSGHVQIP